MTLLQRCESLCRELDRAAGSDRLQVYDVDVIRAAIEAAMAEAWDEGVRATLDQCVPAHVDEYEPDVLRANPYRGKP